MRWKTFLPPIKNMAVDEAKSFIDNHKEGSFILLDICQPVEYEIGHIPGAKHIPLAELSARIGELSSEKPIIVY